MRIRNNGLVHAGGTDILNESSAFPVGLRSTAVVSTTPCCGELGLHTSVPTTLLTGPGVPVNGPPFITRPSTLKAPSPVERLMRALPPRVVHGPAPLWIVVEAPSEPVTPVIGLSTPGAVMTP